MFACHLAPVSIMRSAEPLLVNKTAYINWNWITRIETMFRFSLRLSMIYDEASTLNHVDICRCQQSHMHMFWIVSAANFWLLWCWVSEENCQFYETWQALEDGCDRILINHRFPTIYFLCEEWYLVYFTCSRWSLIHHYDMCVNPLYRAPSSP